MTTVCVDASLVAKMVVRRERLRLQARQLFVDSAIAGGRIIAPPVFLPEVDSVVRFHEHTGRLTSESADLAYGELDGLEITVIDTPGARERARSIARRFNQERAYDSTYAALAEIQGCEFWTADYAFYEAVKSELRFVKFLADYPLPAR